MPRTKPLGRSRFTKAPSGRARMQVKKRSCKCGCKDRSVPYQSASKTLAKLKKVRVAKQKGSGWLEKAKKHLTWKNAGKAALGAYGLLGAAQIATAPVQLYRTGKAAHQFGKVFYDVGKSYHQFGKNLGKY